MMGSFPINHQSVIPWYSQYEGPFMIQLIITVQGQLLFFHHRGDSPLEILNYVSDRDQYLWVVLGTSFDLDSLKRLKKTCSGYSHVVYIHVCSGYITCGHLGNVSDLKKVQFARLRHIILGLNHSCPCTNVYQLHPTHSGSNAAVRRGSYTRYTTGVPVYRVSTRKFCLTKKRVQNFVADVPYQRVESGIFKWHARIQKLGKNNPPSRSSRRP